MSDDTNNILCGDIDTARKRLIIFAELAVQHLDVVSLNAISITTGAHLCGPLGVDGAPLVRQVEAELQSEHAKDWTLASRLTIGGKYNRARRTGADRETGKPPANIHR